MGAADDTLPVQHRRCKCPSLRRGSDRLKSANEGRAARGFDSRLRALGARRSIALVAAALIADRSFAQESSWQRVEGTAARPRPTLSIVERPGSELLTRGARGAELVRRRDGSELEIACTDPAGTGEIRDMSRDPAGLVFVVAERGLFVLGADVDALDPVHLREGAPTGTPTSVFVDAHRRVWIATDKELGAIDPSFYWGRTLGREDGLPAHAPYRVSGDGTGQVRVEAGGEAWSYAPDRGALPVVSDIEIDGRPWRADEVVAKEYGEAPRIAARGTANGGATFRYRVDGNHVWKPLAGDAIEGLQPGMHALDVVALDRDLNRSAPCRVQLVIGYPRYYEKAFVVRVAVLAVVLAIVVALWRAHRRYRGRAAWSRGLVSAALALAIGGQLLAGFVPHAKGWPFIGFSMYTNTYHEDSIIYDGKLVGLEPDGSARKLSVYALGGAFDDRWDALWAIINGGDLAASQWMRDFNAIHPSDPIAGLQVRADRRRLTSHGPVSIAPLILSSYAAKGIDAGR